MGQQVAITGVSGYLGGAIARQLVAAGHSVIALSRRRVDGLPWRAYSLDAAPDPDLLDGTDTLIHCAYDLSLTQWQDIHRVNVEGTRTLLDLAQAHGVRTQLVSSMSAYPGTEQLYGRAKLMSEADAVARGGNAVRPGLVYGGDGGGMVATLERLTRLPLLPAIGARSHQFTVHIDDLALGMQRLVEHREIAGTVAGLAHPAPVRFDELLRGLAAVAGRRTRVVPIPWAPVYGLMRLAEALGATLPLRADSVLGLVRPAPEVSNVALWREIGVELRTWSPPQPALSAARENERSIRSPSM